MLNIVVNKKQNKNSSANQVLPSNFQYVMEIVLTLSLEDITIWITDVFVLINSQSSFSDTYTTLFVIVWFFSIIISAYVLLVDKDVISYAEEAKQFAQHGDMQKAQLMLTKKKLAEKEVRILWNRLVCVRVALNSNLAECHSVLRRSYVKFS